MDLSDIQSVFGDRFPEDEIARYPKDFPYTLHNTNQFALPRIISLRVDHLIALTPIPPTSPSARVDLADFIPINLDSLSFPRRCISYCGHQSTVSASINRTEIGNGVERWLRDAVAKHGERRPYPSLTFSLSRLGQDFGSSLVGSKLLKDLKDEIIFLGVEGDSVETQDSDMALESRPYPTSFSLPLSKTRGIGGIHFREKLEGWLLGQNRSYLGFAVRRQLASTLANYGNDTSVSVLIPSWSSRGHKFTTRMHQVMLHAQFCLQPPGDSAIREGYWESVPLGCIPVVFRRGTHAKFWRNLGVEWDQVAMFIEEKDFREKGSDIVEILRAVPEAAVKSRQRTIAKLVLRVHYAVPSDGLDQGWSTDAFGMLLWRLDRIKRGGRK